MTDKSSDALPGDAELDPVLVAIGDRLRQARLQYGARLKPSRFVSQTEIARAFDVTGVTVGAWEAGKNDAGVPTLFRLADMYGVRRVWLLTGEGEMFDNNEGGQGASSNDPAPSPAPAEPKTPRATIREVKVEKLPIRPSRHPKGKPGRSAVAV